MGSLASYLIGELFLRAQVGISTFPLHNFRYGIGENSIPPWKEKNFSDLALLARAWYARVLPSCGSFELVLLRTSGRGMTTCARTWTMCVLIVEKLGSCPLLGIDELIGGNR